MDDIKKLIEIFSGIKKKVPETEKETKVSAPARAEIYSLACHGERIIKEIGDRVK